MKTRKAVVPGALVSKVSQRVTVVSRIYFSMFEATTMKGKPFV